MNTFNPYDQLGGDARILELANRFYDLMDLEPKYIELRAVHGADLVGAREKMHAFLSGWLGGPPLYAEKYGHPRLRMRHAPFDIGVLERDQWLACMAQAMLEVNVPIEFQNRLMPQLFGMADWMRNRPNDIEPDPQMPNMGAVLSDAQRIKLNAIVAAHGVEWAL